MAGDPADLFAKVMFDYLIDMKYKTDTRTSYSEVFHTLVKQSEKFGVWSTALFRNIPESLIKIAAVAVS